MSAKEKWLAGDVPAAREVLKSIRCQSGKRTDLVGRREAGG